MADLKAYQGEHVTWLELAVDFQAATQVELCQSGGNGEKEHAGTRAIFFASAARRMAVMCQDSLAPVDPFTNSLTPLGLPNARGFPMRPLLLRRDIVNRVLHQAALEHLQTNSKLAFIPQFGQIGEALWNPHVSLDLPRPNPRPDARNGRPEHPPNLHEVQRRPSNVQEVRDQVPWDVTQPYHLPGLNKKQISREQKCLLHNRDADSKGWR